MEYINLRHLAFGEVDIKDTFFDSLKADYPGFEKWYEKKALAHQDVYVQYDEKGELQGFLYMKIEESNIVKDVSPNIIADNILKIGTFKINAHRTKMGEQFLKVIFDYAMDKQVDVCYLTIYEKHKGLIELIKKYGFREWGVKGQEENQEKVFLKNMHCMTGEIFDDYPMVEYKGHKKYLLSIYPKYHSRMFPESILTNENRNIIKDISYTNSIQKVYVCSMQGVEKVKRGDIIVLYRTAESGRTAEYSAVATTVCTVIDIKLQNDFEKFEDFYQYASRFTVFDRADLAYWYNRGGLKIINLVYNFPLKKRIVRHELIEKIGLDRDKYWGFFELSEKEFLDIVAYGQAKDYLK